MTWMDAELINKLANEAGAGKEATEIAQNKDIPGKNALRSIFARKAQYNAMMADYHCDSVGEWLDYLAESVVWAMRAASVTGVDLGAEIRRKLGGYEEHY